MGSKDLRQAAALGGGHELAVATAGPLPSEVPLAWRSLCEPHCHVDDDTDQDDPEAHSERHREPVPAIHRDTSSSVSAKTGCVQAPREVAQASPIAAETAHFRRSVRSCTDVLADPVRAVPERAPGHEAVAKVTASLARSRGEIRRCVTKVETPLGPSSLSGCGSSLVPSGLSRMRWRTASASLRGRKEAVRCHRLRISITRLRVSR